MVFYYDFLKVLSDYTYELSKRKSLLDEQKRFIYYSISLISKAYEDNINDEKIKNIYLNLIFRLR